MLNSNNTILHDGEEEFLCLSSNVDLIESDKWESLIREHASYDQKKTSIRLERAYCRVYQPSHYGDKTFDPLRKILSDVVTTAIESIGRLEDRKLYLEEGAWGLIYADGESCGPHGHGKHNQYAGVYYIKTDPGCGSIYFPTIGMEIEPSSKDLVLFSSRLQHGVMPNLVKDAERVCIAFNVRLAHEVKNK